MRARRRRARPLQAATAEPDTHVLALMIVSTEKEHRLVEHEVLLDSLFALRRLGWRPTRCMPWVAVSTATEGGDAAPR